MPTTDENVDLMSGEDLTWLVKSIYGPTLLSLGACPAGENHGKKSEELHAIIDAWIDPYQPDMLPSEENMERMRAMLRVWFLLSPVVGRGMAFWWFAGMIEGSFVGVRNDEDHESPGGLAHTGKLDELMARAELFRYYVDNDVWM